MQKAAFGRFFVLVEAQFKAPQAIILRVSATHSYNPEHLALHHQLFILMLFWLCTSLLNLILKRNMEVTA